MGKKGRSRRSFGSIALKSKQALAAYPNKKGGCELTATLEIFICLLAVLGLYAILVRLALLLGGRESYATAILAEDKSFEEILTEAELLRLRGEISTRGKKTVVLLEREDENKETALRKEGFLVYIRK